MKPTLFLLLIALSISCNTTGKKDKKTATIEKVATKEKTSTEERTTPHIIVPPGARAAGSITSMTYVNPEFDLTIEIPYDFSVYYPQIKEIYYPNPLDSIWWKTGVPEEINQKLSDNSIICIGFNGKNYLSVYKVPHEEEEVNQKEGSKEVIISSITNYKNFSNMLCKDLEERYAGDQEVAFKQNWSDMVVAGRNYDVFEINMVSYPDEELIIGQRGYVRKFDDYDLFFTMIYEEGNHSAFTDFNLEYTL